MTNKKQKLLIVFLLSLVITGMLFTYSRKDFITKKLNDLKLVKIEETFTELYFSDYPILTAKDIVRNKKISFTFVIHNLENKDKEYKYSIYFKSAKGFSKLLDSNVLSIENDESITVANQYVLTGINIDGKIVVKLEDLNQEIFFWIPNKK